MTFNEIRFGTRGVCSARPCHTAIDDQRDRPATIGALMLGAAGYIDFGMTDKAS